MDPKSGTEKDKKRSVPSLYTLFKTEKAENSLYQKRVSRLFQDEQESIHAAFVKMSGAEPDQSANKTVSLEMLKAYIAEALPEPMIIRFYNGISTTDADGKTPAVSQQISKEQLMVFTLNLFKGNIDEKGGSILGLIATQENHQVNGTQVKEFIEDVISALVHILHFRKLLNGWVPNTSEDSINQSKALASLILSELKPADKSVLEEDQLLNTTWDRNDIGNWIYHVPMVSTFLTMIISQGMSIMPPSADTPERLMNYLPMCKYTKQATCESILTLPLVLYINSYLPTEVQHRWRFLFSTRAHGESFSQLLGQIVNQGPTILLIKDSEGNIFGGFASQSWEVKPQFQGDNTCFLFTLLPRIEVYTYTGYNDHYMYLNYGQQTMPNGLGMGGQHDYFGLWIDSSFGKGHSKAKPRSTTYNSPQLSSTEDFTIDVLEVWALGDLPQSPGEEGKKSVLDADPEALALLEMAGKTLHSKGLRGEESDEE